MCNNEEDNPYDLSEDEIHLEENEEIYYKTLEDQLREIGMSIHDFI